MKVSKLIEELQKLDPDSECILQGDSEGNSYKTLEGVDGEAIFVPEHKGAWCGEVYGIGRGAEDNGFEEHEWKKLLKKKRCAVLFPTN